MDATAEPAKRIHALWLLAIGAGLLLSLHFFHPLAGGLWHRTFFNSLHVLVFSFIALALFAATNVFTGKGFTHNAIIAGSTAIALGLVSEAAQIPGPRDASIEDIIADASGAIGGLLIALASNSAAFASWKARSGFYLAGTAILLAALIPLISVSAAYIERSHEYPVLVSFDSNFARTFVRIQNATLTIVARPTASRKVGQVSLHDGAWPGLIIHDIWPDWRNYSFLIIHLALAEEEPLDINIRVHDRWHKLGDQPYSDRFNMTLAMQPGQHRLRIPLEKIRSAPQERQMDLSKIDGIVLFCSPKDAGRQFELLEIRLE